MSDIERPWDAPPPSTPEDDQARVKRRLAWVVTAVAILGLVGWCSVETKQNMDEADANGDEGGSTAICRQYVKERLKSPSTADFSSEAATQDGGSGPDWTVTGFVDSQNSFGGTVRNAYRCEVTSTGDDAWTLRDLETEGN